jgi:hypothetical protein
MTPNTFNLYTTIHSTLPRAGARGAYVSSQPTINYPERWVPLRSTRTDLVVPTLAAIETAIAFWGLLLPAGQRGQALRHMDMITDSSTGDVTNHPSKEPGWKPEYNALWFEYLPLFLGSFRRLLAVLVF